MHTNKKIKQSKRSHFMVFIHHKSDRISYRPKKVPGNNSYADVVKFGKKTFILGTSIIKGIRMKKFDQKCVC